MLNSKSRNIGFKGSFRSSTSESIYLFAFAKSGKLNSNKSTQGLCLESEDKI